jgi:MerR family transcriptional regulator, redox-sensitive transcriptional activator SoxR
MVEVKVDFKSSVFLEYFVEGIGRENEDWRARQPNTSAIRYYEKCGVLAAPYRIGGQRRYPSDAVHRVLLIRFASEMGFTLSEIKLFLSGLRDKAPVGPRWRKLASRKIKEVDETIERCCKLKSLLEHLVRCHCPSLQVCVERLSLSPNLSFAVNKEAREVF